MKLHNLHDTQEKAKIGSRLPTSVSWAFDATIPIADENVDSPPFHFQEVKRMHYGQEDEDGTEANISEKRQRSRVGLVEFGRPFMEVSTPFEILTAVYDLLETTRLMYRKHGLFRNLGNDNVFCKEVIDSEIIHKADSKMPPTFHSTRHLLRISTVDPHTAHTLLIDFDRPELPSDQAFKGNIFTARAIRQGYAPGRIGTKVKFPPVPNLANDVAGVYQTLFPERLEAFKDAKDIYSVTLMAPPRVHGYRSYYYGHAQETKTSTIPALRHHAESAFWLLVWWVIHATPSGRSGTYVPDTAFEPARGADNRPLKFYDNEIDPWYGPMEKLLNQLGESVENDLFWAKQTPYDDSEYLHEVLQRHLLNFLCLNHFETFMRLPKWKAPRKTLLQ